MYGRCWSPPLPGWCGHLFTIATAACCHWLSLMQRLERPFITGSAGTIWRRSGKRLSREIRKQRSEIPGESRQKNGDRKMRDGNSFPHRTDSFCLGERAGDTVAGGGALVAFVLKAERSSQWRLRPWI